MSNYHKIEFKFKELCIIKHALKRQCETKEKDYAECEKVNYSVTEKERKDLQEEKKLLLKITNMINSIKERYK